MDNTYKLARIKRDGRTVWTYLWRVTDTATVESPCDYASGQIAEEAYQMGLQEGARGALEVK